MSLDKQTLFSNNVALTLYYMLAHQCIHHDAESVHFCSDDISSTFSVEEVRIWVAFVSTTRLATR